MWETAEKRLEEIGRPEARDTHQETGDPARLPAQLAGRWGQRNWISVWCRKKISCTGLTRAAKAEQKSLVPALQAQRTNQERISFICPLWVPICLSFNSQQGPLLYSLCAGDRREETGWKAREISCKIGELTRRIEKETWTQVDELALSNGSKVARSQKTKF